MLSAPLPPPPPPQVPVPPPSSGDAALMDAARALEATFLSEMLKASGLGELPDSFGGGIGEEQFQSFLIDAQAREMVEVGGIGLAQAIFDALAARAHV